MAECKYQKTTLPTVARKKNTSRNIYVSAQCVVFNGGRYKPRNLSQSSWVIIPIVRTPDNPTTNAFRRRKGSPRTLLRERVLAALGWLLLVVFFIASIFILTARWFVTTQLSSHSDEIAAFIAETTGIDITAERMDVGFTVIHPVISLHNVKLSRRGGPVSLSLPSVQAELSWSSLWHLEPRFSTLIISHPTLDIRKVDENHWDVAGFAINTSLSTTSSEAEAGQRFSRWLFGQGRLMIEDGTFRYHDESSSTNGPLTLERVTAVFRQELFDYRTAVSGILMEGSTPRSFDLRARIRKTYLLCLTTR